VFNGLYCVRLRLNPEHGSLVKLMHDFIEELEQIIVSSNQVIIAAGDNLPDCCLGCVTHPD
jgi:hypothetical protein